MDGAAAREVRTKQLEPRLRLGRIRILGSTLGVMTLAFVVLASWILVDSKRDTLNQAEQSLENLTYSMEQGVNRRFQLLDLSLRTVGETLTRLGTEKIGPGLRDEKLFDPPFDAGLVDSIRVLDRDGTLIASSAGLVGPGESDSQSMYFQAQRDARDTGVYVDSPRHDAKTGHLQVAVSRRLENADGTFAGVVVAMLRTSYFDGLDRPSAVGADGVMAIVRDDGTVLARAPRVGEAPGSMIQNPSLLAQFRAANSGHLVDVSPVDGVERLYAFARLSNAPIYVTMAMATHTVFGRWRQKAMALGGILALLTATSIALASLFALELHRRQQAETQAQKNEVRYRLLAENSGDIIVLLGRDGRRRYVSAAVKEVLGYAPAELVGQSITSLVAPEDHAVIEAGLADLRGAIDVITVHFRCARRDGPTAWMEARMRAVRNPLTGETDEIISNLRDISVRKAAEEKMTAAALELAQLAATDGLTGLANRRHFDDMLEREWRRAMREQLPLSLVMLDADLFKSYNDSHGHQEGDEVLRIIAGCLRHLTRRPGDVAARYGGEEFAVIMPATDEFGAMQVAENIRLAVAAAAIPHSGSPTGVVTVSLGVASMVVVRDTDWTGLLAAADAALYDAKRSGRNRVACSDPAIRNAVRIAELET